MNINYKASAKSRGFTLVEVLVVIGIIVVLTLVVLYTLNPHNLITQGQDGNRVAGVSSLDKAISLYYSNAISNPATLSMGTAGVEYISIPDPTATTTAGTNCAGLGLASTSTTYHCAASSTYLKVDGTGWVPINFTSYPGGSPIASLPVDPINTTSTGEYYMYETNGTQYEVEATPASQKDVSSTADFEQGTDLALIGTSTVEGGGTGGGGGGGGGGTYTSSTFAVGTEGYGATLDTNTGTMWVSGASGIAIVNETTFATSTFLSPINGSFSSDPNLMAFDPITKTMWVVDSGTNKVTAINDTTFASTTYSLSGTQPWGIIYDSHTNTIWVAEDSKTVIFNGTTSAMTSINFPSDFLAYDPPNTIWGDGYTGLVSINDTTFVTSTYSVASDTTDNGIVFDSNTNSIWAVGENGSTIVNLTTGATSTISNNCVTAIAFDSSAKTIWELGSNTCTWGIPSTMFVINDTTFVTSTYSSLIPLEAPGYISFDSDTNAIWTPGSVESSTRSVTVFTPSE